jgi:hypothetical protein
VCGHRDRNREEDPEQGEVAHVRWRSKSRSANVYPTPSTRRTTRKRNRPHPTPRSLPRPMPSATGTLANGNYSNSMGHQRLIRARVSCHVKPSACGRTTVRLAAGRPRYNAQAPTAVQRIGGEEPPGQGEDADPASRAGVPQLGYQGGNPQQEREPEEHGEHQDGRELTGPRQRPVERIPRKREELCGPHGGRCPPGPHDRGESRRCPLSRFRNRAAGTRVRFCGSRMSAFKCSLTAAKNFVDTSEHYDI